MELKELHNESQRYHRQYKHDITKGLVTIAGHPNDDLAIKTLKGIYKQAGIDNV